MIAMSFMKRVFLVLVALMLIVFGVRGIALTAVGVETIAVVTNTRQVVDSSSDAMDHNYEVRYRFMVDGTEYTGSYRMNKVYNVSHLPSPGTTVPIRYLKAYPNWNGGKGDGALGGILIGGLGLIMIGLAIKPKRKLEPPPPVTERH